MIKDSKQHELYVAIVDFYDKNGRMPTYKEMIKLGSSFKNPTRCVFNALAQLCMAGALIRVEHEAKTDESGNTSRYSYYIPDTPEAEGIEEFYRQSYKPRGIPTYYSKSPAKSSKAAYRKAMKEMAKYGY